MFEALTKYAEFSGRSRRKEYWLFMLMTIIVTMVLAAIDITIDTFDYEIGMGTLSGIFILIIFIPSLAVSVRRLHDTDRTGWWMLASVIPIINLIVMVFMCLKGTDGSNQYGSDPLT